MSGKSTSQSQAQQTASDICQYLTVIADQHSRCAPRSRNSAMNSSEQVVSFVLRRCIEDIARTYEIDLPHVDDRMVIEVGKPFDLDVSAANHTFRNRARW